MHLERLHGAVSLAQQAAVLAERALLRPRALRGVGEVVLCLGPGRVGALDVREQLERLLPGLGEVDKHGREKAFDVFEGHVVLLCGGHAVLVWKVCDEGACGGCSPSASLVKG